MNINMFSAVGTAIASIRRWIVSLEEAKASIEAEIRAFSEATEQYECQISQALQAGMPEEQVEGLLEEHQKIKSKIIETQDQLTIFTRQLENFTETANRFLMVAKSNKSKGS